MANFLTDNFTDTNGTAITSHTPDTGGSWSLHAGTNGTIQTNRAAGGGDFGYFFHSVAATTDGESVEATLKLIPSATQMMMLLRCNPASGGSFYSLWWNGTGLDLWRKVNGSFDPGASMHSFTGFTATSDHVMKFTVSGTGATVTLEAFMDGTSKGTYADTSANRITTLGAAGFTTWASSSAGYHIDSIVANDNINAAAASSLILPRASRRQQHLLVR